MRKFDSFGLHLAEYQGKIFEESLKRMDCSSLIFLRRFKLSRLANQLDHASQNILFDVNVAYEQLNEQFPASNYGKEKYSPEALYWLGYIYRYICYTRDISTRLLFKIIPPQKLIANYYVYHTQSEEWVFERILDLTEKDEDYFDKNKRLKKFLVGKKLYR